MGLSQYSVEDRREVAGRGVDDAEDFGGRGLLLQGLTRLGDEARVLHRDNGLRRKVLQQRDLLVGKRLRMPAVNRQRAHKNVVLPQRNRQQAAAASDLDEPAGIFMAGAVM